MKLVSILTKNGKNVGGEFRFENRKGTYLYPDVISTIKEMGYISVEGTDILLKLEHSFKPSPFNENGVEVLTLTSNKGDLLDVPTKDIESFKDTVELERYKVIESSIKKFVDTPQALEIRKILSHYMSDTPAKIKEIVKELEYRQYDSLDGEAWRDSTKVGLIALITDRKRPVGMLMRFSSNDHPFLVSDYHEVISGHFKNKVEIVSASEELYCHIDGFSVLVENGSLTDIPTIALSRLRMYPTYKLFKEKITNNPSEAYDKALSTALSKEDKIPKSTKGMNLFQ